METEQIRPAVPRLWEIDAVRGIAVILMIIFHFVFDLTFFGASTVDIYSTPWQLFARSIGTTFITVLGVSLTLRYDQLKPQMDRRQMFRVYLKRGATLFAWGMVITVVTYFAVGRRFVVFGILHLLGLSVILAFPFLQRRWASLGVGLLALGLGAYLGSVKVLYPWLLWLGVPQFRRGMVDYYPILPWFGFALLGVFVGLTFYPHGVRRFRLPDLSQAPLIRALSYLGRHSLVIYLVHQPILLGLLILVGIGSF